MNDPYRAATLTPSGDLFRSPRILRVFRWVSFIALIALTAGQVHYENECARRTAAEKHAATLAKIRRMTWPEMLPMRFP